MNRIEKIKEKSKRNMNGIQNNYNEENLKIFRKYKNFSIIMPSKMESNTLPLKANKIKYKVEHELAMFNELIDSNMQLVDTFEDSIQNQFRPTKNIHRYKENNKTKIEYAKSNCFSSSEYLSPHSNNTLLKSNFDDKIFNIKSNLFGFYTRLNNEEMIDSFPKHVASHIDTPCSAVSDDVQCDFYKETINAIDINEFMKNSNCHCIIIAVIFKLISTKNPLSLVKYFKKFTCFIPKTLLLGFVFLMRLSNKIMFESIKDVVETYFVCCVTAMKSLKDGCSKMNQMNIENINKLEALILNKLEYNINIDINEIKSAIIEIRAIDLLRRLDPLIFERW